MFLRGIFTFGVESSLKADTLYQISNSLGSVIKREIVRDRVDEVINVMEKGRVFNSPLAILKYTHTSRRYDELNKIGDKTRKKEFNLHSFDDETNKLPFGTVDTNSLDTSNKLVYPVEKSWETLRHGEDIDSVEFDDELRSMVKRYNELSDYIYDTYATDFKKLLLKVAMGVSASRKHLDTILLTEDNQDYYEVVSFLISFVEFFEFLHSEEVKLIV